MQELYAYGLAGDRRRSMLSAAFVLCVVTCLSSAAVTLDCDQHALNPGFLFSVIVDDLDSSSSYVL